MSLVLLVIHPVRDAIAATVLRETRMLVESVWLLETRHAAILL
jgi:hypothetical protein